MHDEKKLHEITFLVLARLMMLTDETFLQKLESVDCFFGLRKRSPTVYEFLEHGCQLMDDCYSDDYLAFSMEREATLWLRFQPLKEEEINGILLIKNLLYPIRTRDTSELWNFFNSERVRYSFSEDTGRLFQKIMNDYYEWEHILYMDSMPFQSVLGKCRLIKRGGIYQGFQNERLNFVQLDVSHDNGLQPFLRYIRTHYEQLENFYGIKDGCYRNADGNVYCLFCNIQNYPYCFFISMFQISQEDILKALEAFIGKIQTVQNEK